MKKMLPENNLFKTSDISLAASLISYYPLINIDSRNPKKVIFIFEKDNQFDQILRKFWQGSLRIEPKQYFNNIKILKSRIYNI